MKAIQWNGQGLSLNNIPIPEPGSGEALIKVRCAGVCNTDLEITKGYFNFQGTLGHEFVGLVEECKDAPEYVGQRVVCDINCACGSCSVCEAQDPHHCPKRSTIGIFNKDGAFSEYLVAPVKNLMVVRDELTDECAVFTEPLAAALEIPEQLDLDVRDEVCVLGDGKLGLLIAMSLGSLGFKVLLVGRHPERFEKIPNMMGVRFSKELPQELFKTVVEATGNPKGFEAAISLTQPRGQIVLKSTYHQAFSFNPVMIVVNEIRIQGSRCGPYDKALALLEKGAIDPSSLISETYSLEQGLRAIDKASEPGILKVLLQI